jgi:hypothetical protein
MRNLLKIRSHHHFLCRSDFSSRKINIYPIIAVPLSNHDEPDSYCIDAHVLQVNRLRHVFEQADSSDGAKRRSGIHGFQ